MLHTVERDTNDFLATLLPEALEHERIPTDAATREAATINRYLAAAIQATENYLDKDVFPTTHTYSGPAFPFEWTRGNVRSVSVLVPVQPVATPVVWEPYSIEPMLYGGTDLRAGCLRIGDSIYRSYFPYVDPGYPDADYPVYPYGYVAGYYAHQLVIEGGFAEAADLPPDVVQFILAVFGTHYEVRESSNYSSMVFNVDNYPKYLLDSYRTLSYA